VALKPRDWASLWFIPATALLLFVGAALDLGPARRAARGEGIHGTFTATRPACGKGPGCSWHGDFVSDDGALRLTDVLIDDGDKDVVDRVGQTVTAIYAGRGSTPTVYPAEGSDGWVIAAWIFASGVLVYVAYFFLLGLSVYRYRRDYRSVGRPAP
jgi:hypothetical protein